MQKLIRWISRQFRRKGVQQLAADIRKNKYQPGLFKNFDWFLFFLVIGIALFGVVSIFAATSLASGTEVRGFLNILRSNTQNYAGLQLLWLLIGIIVMIAVSLLDYRLYGKYAQFIYLFNMLVLLIVLTVEAGRGGMTAFFQVGSETGRLGQRTFQPSEFGKIAMIIALAKLFAQRQTPINNLRELWPTLLFLGIPMILVFLQPDFGTAIVYGVIYVVLLYISGTNRKLLYSSLLIIILVLFVLWKFLNTASDSFRLDRIRMWLYPDRYPDSGRQVANGKIALGSGGLTGKGIVSIGSFASLGYIPDDHTDFCFSIVGEAFGLVGTVSLVIAFMIFLGRLIQHAIKTQDKFGEYIIVGTAAMFTFHIFENIGMILNLLPVTGIPLPFISYGGSNLLTNMAALGLVMNVVMRSKQKQSGGLNHYTRQI